MKIISALLLLISIFGCSKHESGGESKITISLSSILSSKAIPSGSKIEHIIINISGLGMSPLFWDWDSHNQVVAAPTTVEQAVPKGADRLFQIIVVVEDASSQMLFYYGDVIKHLVLDTESVDVIVRNVGTGTGETIMIKSRYVDTAGNGPTGTLNAKYSPPNGKPKMQIMTSAIFGGWTELFAVDGVSFDYELENGTILFPNIDLRTITFDSHLMKIAMPSEYFWLRQESGTIYLDHDEGRQEDVVVGFMGPGKASYSVCYDPADSNVTFKTISGDGDYGLYIDDTGTTPLKYSSTGTLAEHIYRADGGTSMAGCSANGSMFSTLLTFDPGKFTHGGIEASIGVRGPYQIMDIGFSHYGFAKVTPSGASTLIEWDYLPGTTGQSDSLDGTAIFYIDNMADDQHDKIYANGPGIDCPNLASYGFAEMAKIPASSTSYTIPINVSTGTKPMIILCPYKSRTYFTAGADARYHDITGTYCQTTGAGWISHLDSGSSPYEICNLSQMNNLANTATQAVDWSYSYKLMESIDMTGYTGSPIGNTTNNFTGSFDGNGHLLSNLTLSLGGVDNVGLFGFFTGVSISGLRLESINISGNDYVGGLVGYHSSGTINACSVSGTVTGNAHIGGLVGSSMNAIANSYSDVNITATSSPAGGFAGSLDGSGSISNSYSTGTVTSNTSGTILGAGGFIGAIVGGTSTLSGSFTTSTSVTGVSPANEIGPFVGTWVTAPVNSFYITGASCANNGTGGCNTQNSPGVAESTFYLNTNEPYATGAWDFGNIWKEITNGLPVFQWQ